MLDSSPPPECEHANVEVHFDPVAARKMNVAEIRKTFPRFYGKCPDCGCDLIKYASYVHYLMGDW